MKLDGLSALVSGGASGLGLATADVLTSAGARVTILDLASSAGADVAARLPNAKFVAGDVRDELDVQKAVDSAGELRIAVSCAGIGGSHRILGQDGLITLELFRRVVETNLFGTFNVLRLGAQRMAMLDPIENERGVIVNTASIAAYEGQIGQIPYAASKAGIVGLTLPAARDLASQLIRVMTIAPGVFDTPLLGRISDDVRGRLSKAIPHPKRLGQPVQFAALVRHIVENQMLNGAVIRLDGAIRMAPR